jgi:hypothetical protein
VYGTTKLPTSRSGNSSRWPSASRTKQAKSGVPKGDPRALQTRPIRTEGHLATTTRPKAALPARQLMIAVRLAVRTSGNYRVKKIEINNPTLTTAERLGIY